MAGAQPGCAQPFAWEQALVGEIVDGEQGARRREHRIARFHAQVHRQQRGLPVLAVQDVRRPSRVSEQRQRGAAERAEAFQIVGVVAAALAIQPGAVEQSVVGDEMHGHRAARETALEEPHRDSSIAQRDLRLADGAKPELLAIDRTIRRHDDAHVASDLR
jgi:hypothetical protein